jgi:hypothetical protein
MSAERNPIPKTVIKAGYIVGAVLIVTGVYIYGYIMWWDLFRDHTSYVPGRDYNFSTPSPFDLWHWLVPIFLGGFVLGATSNRNYYWYREVRGEVTMVGRDYEVGLLGSDYFTLFVRGKNRAGLFLVKEISVDFGSWMSYRNGRTFQI